MSQILLVEDDAQLAHIYAQVLTAHGHHVSVAENGQEAIERATEAPPDLILMDIHMPVMDGIEATEQLKASPLAHIPIYALTNLQLPEEISAALEAGCDGYIVKPANPQDLAEELVLLLAE